MITDSFDTQSRPLITPTDIYEYCGTTLETLIVVYSGKLIDILLENNLGCAIVKDSKDVIEATATEHCEKQRTIKSGFEFPSFCYAMATGIGKTRLMGACIYYLYKTCITFKFRMCFRNII